MEIQKLEAGENYYIQRLGNERVLVPTGRWDSTMSTIMDTGRASGLMLNYALGYMEPDLSFLQPWPITSLRVLDWQLTDLRPMEILSSTLENLDTASTKGKTLELAKFPHLNTLGASWAQIKDTIAESPALEDLYLYAYRGKDLTPMAHLLAMKRIRFKGRPSIRSLDGVESLNRLEELGIYGAPLEDLKAIRSCSKESLSSLDLESCSRFGHLDVLGELTSLKFLGLGDCKDLASIAPLQPLQVLEKLHIWGTTKILDDDLSPILDLPALEDVRIKERKSYTPSASAVKQTLYDRHGIQDL